MNSILFSLILFVSRLPLKVIYVLTDFLTFFVFKVVKYRTSVVYDNIRNSFPEKTEKEIANIVKGFYTHFSSLIAEIIKIFTISEEEHYKILEIKNIDILLNKPNKNVNTVILLGHVMNWEASFILKKFTGNINIKGTYMKIQNKFWNEKIYNLRSKYGVDLILMENTIELMRKTPNDGSAFFCLIGDQSPQRSKAKFSLDFFGRETPIFVGYDFLSVEKGFDVFYLELISKERGKYEYIFHKIEPDNNNKFEKLEISKKYFTLLEKTIRNNPANYLWTHKRWKHKKGVDY